MKTNRPFCCLAVLVNLLTLPLALLSQRATAEPVPSSSERSCFVYFGTYMRDQHPGIYVARINLDNGALSRPELAAEAISPSFVAIDVAHRRLFSADQMHTADGKWVGSIGAYSVDEKTGKLHLLNREVTTGGEFCHISLDRTGSHVLAARYGDANAVVLPVDEAGRVQPITSTVQHEGSGPNHHRQDRAHAHSINLDFDNRFALVADLGLDQIRIYRFDASAGKLTPNEPAFATVAPGAGPRHVAFHPSGRYAFVINEMASSVTAFSYDEKKGTLKEIQTVPLLVPGTPGENTAAEVVVHPSGKFLYASNRGHDCLLVFSIDDATGRLSFIQRLEKGFSHPRNFAIDPTGSWLLCANRDSNDVGVYRIDPYTGKLTEIGRVSVPLPVCVRFLPQ